MWPLPKIRPAALLAACLLLSVFYPHPTARAKDTACPAYEQLRPLLNSERIELHDPRYLTLADLQHLDAATARHFQRPDAAWERMLQVLAEVCVLPR